MFLGIRKFSLKIIFAGLLLMFTQVGLAETKNVWVAAGADGIYASQLDVLTGKVSKARQVVNDLYSAYITKHPTLDVIYSINRSSTDNSVSSYQFDEAGNLTLQSRLGGQSNGGVHIEVSPNGQYLAVAYYRGGVVSVYRLDDHGAIVGEFATARHEGHGQHVRQKSPHPHWIGFDRSSSLIYVPDLGNDHIWVHAIDEDNQQLTLHQKVATPKGAGPRNMIFHKDLNMAFVSDELVSRASRYQIDPETGKLHYLDSQINAKEAEHEAWHSVSDIRLHPNGEFLYLVSRGFDQVSVFSIDQTFGTLTPVEREPVRGSIARSMVLDGSGHWALVAGSTSNTVAVFHVNNETGELQYRRQILSVPNAMAIVTE